MSLKNCRIIKSIILLFIGTFFGIVISFFINYLFIKGSNENKIKEKDDVKVIWNAEFNSDLKNDQYINDKIWKIFKVEIENSKYYFVVFANRALSIIPIKDDNENKQ